MTDMRGRSVREVQIGDLLFEVGSGIDLWDDECWRAWACDVWGNLEEIADGATRQDAEDNVIDILKGRYGDY